MSLPLSRREQSMDELVNALRDTIHTMLVLLCLLTVSALASVLDALPRVRSKADMSVQAIGRRDTTAVPNQT